MRIDIFTIFPGYFDSAFATSVLGRARDAELVDLHRHDLRDWASDRHRSVDDTPFGGGAGMVLSPGPVAAAVDDVDPPRPLLLLSPAGKVFDQSVARRLAASDGFSLLCGRYEGVDQRIVDRCCDGELSIGDYVLGGGEAAAAVVIEAVARLIPGVLGNDASAGEESFHDGLLEYPHYTRPADFAGRRVPGVLLSGDHGRIARWRRAASLRRTLARRPDLLTGDDVSDADRAVLEEFPDAGAPEA
ncbi:MAG: tRNA (guanosine(37)-N1)-methyltransferase TrmD [Acidimicrobiia bacterium]